MPRTFRNVSCCPANDASGRSSAVALERTANDASASLDRPRRPTSRTPPRISVSRSGGNGCATTAARIRSPPRPAPGRRRCPDPATRALIRSARPVSPMKRRYASAVVAKPSGTRTPSPDRFEIISPRTEFFPPTCSRSRPRPPDGLGENVSGSLYHGGLTVRRKWFQTRPCEIGSGTPGGALQPVAAPGV